MLDVEGFEFIGREGQLQLVARVMGFWDIGKRDNFIEAFCRGIARECDSIYH